MIQFYNYIQGKGEILLLKSLEFCYPIAALGIITTFTEVTELHCSYPIL